MQLLAAAMLTLMAGPLLAIAAGSAGCCCCPNGPKPQGPSLIGGLVVMLVVPHEEVRWSRLGAALLGMGMA